MKNTKTEKMEKKNPDKKKGIGKKILYIGGGLASGIFLGGIGMYLYDQGKISELKEVAEKNGREARKATYWLGKVFKKD